MPPAAPVRLRRAAAGRILAVEFPAHVAAADREFLNLLHRWEVVRRPASKYCLPEADGAEACYSRPVGRPNVILKQRSLATAEQTLLRSRFEVEFTGTAVSSFQGEEQSVVGPPEEPLFQTWYRMTLASEAARDLPATLKSVDQVQFTAVPAAGAVSILDALKEAERNDRWGAVAADLVLDQLEGATTVSSAALADALGHLKDRLAVHGAVGREEILVRLRNVPVSDDSTVSAALVHALASAASSEVRAGLRTILEPSQGFPDVTVLQALVAAGGSVPDLELLGLLAHYAHADPDTALKGFGVRQMAMLALGRLAESSPQLREELDERLRERFAAGVADTEAAVALEVLTNAGIVMEQATSRAEELAASSDARLRRAAVEYLASLLNASKRAELHAAQDDNDASIRATVQRVLAPEP